jgi:hypothetical protein
MRYRVPAPTIAGLARLSQTRLGPKGDRPCSSGTIIVNKDGAPDAYNEIGDGGRVILDISDPDHVTGTEVVHLAGSGANRRRYLTDRPAQR